MVERELGKAKNNSVWILHLKDFQPEIYTLKSIVFATSSSAIKNYSYMNKEIHTRVNDERKR